MDPAHLSSTDCIASSGADLKGFFSFLALCTIAAVAGFQAKHVGVCERYNTPPSAAQLTRSGRNRLRPVSRDRLLPAHRPLDRRADHL